MDEEIIYSNFLTVIDILGTFAFAVSGAFSAMEKKLDPFGILVIAFVTAIGGGTLRDILVGNVPVNWMNNSVTIIVILGSAILAMLFSTTLKKFNTGLFLFDALGLGLFTIVGVEIGIKYGFNAMVSVSLGTITACFGGVLRDVLLNKVPLIFQKEIYALACIIGAILYYFLYGVNINDDVAKVACIILIFIIRFIAVRYKLSLPQFNIK